MPVNFDRLKGRETEFNNKYHTSFSYSGFYSKIHTFNRLVADNAANVVYKGTLGTVLKDVMIRACGNERTSQNSDGSVVDLKAVVDDFEEYLMQPFIKECKNANEPLYPKPYGGMTEEEKIALVERVIEASPKNDVEITMKAYTSGQIRIRDMRECVGEMNFTNHNVNMELRASVSEENLKRIGTFMLALENVNKSRSTWWRIFHPFRNNAEKREAREMKTLLGSFGGNALERAKQLATSEYKTITVTKESIQNAKAELEREKNKSEPQEHKINELNLDDKKAQMKVDLGNEPKGEISEKIEHKEINQPVNVKNV